MRAMASCRGGRLNIKEKEMLDETCKLLWIKLENSKNCVPLVERKINKFLEDNAQICVSATTQHNEDYTEWVATIVYIPKSPD